MVRLIALHTGAQWLVCIGCEVVVEVHLDEVADATQQLTPPSMNQSYAEVDGAVDMCLVRVRKAAWQVRPSMLALRCVCKPLDTQ